MTTPIEKVIEAFSGQAVKPSGDSGQQYVALCPAHPDSQHSLTIGVGADGRVVLTCFAGCPTERVIKSVGLEWVDLFEEQEVMTLSRLAVIKRLPVEWLASECGLRDLDKGLGVGIPYQDEARKTLFFRRRVRAKSRTLQQKGKSLQAYGQWRLKDARAAKELVVVEGESDCWTLWHHGFPAMGLPGATTAKTLEPQYIKDIPTLYIWQEPGESGRTFIDKVARRLKSLEYPGKAKLLRSDAAKDPSALHILDPDGFKVAFREMLEKAPDLPPPGRRQGKGGVPGVVAELVAAATAAAGPPAGGCGGGSGDGKGNGDVAPPSIPGPSPGYFGLTDLGNAQRLVFLHGKDLRYCHHWGKWMVWQGNCWREDGTGEVWRRMADTVRAIYAEAAAAKGDLQDELMKHAVESEGGARIKSAVEIAKSVLPVPVEPKAFDGDPWLFNTLNATIDLKTGTAFAPRREDHITKVGSVMYDHEATCPTWLAFLHKIMGGRADVVRFLQLAVGYSLTADVREKCFVFMYGSGDNGKSTAIEIIMELLGDYSLKMHADAILAKSASSSGIPNDIARLAGVRMVSTAELPEGRRLDEAKVKDLTGNDTITARFMRGEWFDFRPVFKLWMYGNHKPVIRGADDGIWKRVRLVPFDVTIPRAEQDRTLLTKLRAELPGILNWAVEGCLAWQREGLPTPRDVEQAAKDYRSEMDGPGEFLRDRCLVSNAAGVRVEVGELYKAYASWVRDRGEYPESQRGFGGKLKGKGYKQDRGTHGVWYWLGITLLPPHSGDASHNGHHANGDSGDFLAAIDA